MVPIQRVCFISFKFIIVIITYLHILVGIPQRLTTTQSIPSSNINQKKEEKEEEGIDIGVGLEDQEKADYTVCIPNLDIPVSQLRKEMDDQSEIPFKFSFIVVSSGYYF